MRKRERERERERREEREGKGMRDHSSFKEERSDEYE